MTVWQYDKGHDHDIDHDHDEDDDDHHDDEDDDADADEDDDDDDDDGDNDEDDDDDEDADADADDDDADDDKNDDFAGRTWQEREPVGGSCGQSEIEKLRWAGLVVPKSMWCYLSEKVYIWASVHYNIIKLINCLEQVHRNLMLLYFPSLMPFCPNVLFKCLFSNALSKCFPPNVLSKYFVQMFYPNFFFKCLSKYFPQMIYANVLPK